MRAVRTSLRSRLIWLLPASFTVVWLLFVSINSHWGRVADHWASSLAMVFGSFIGASTPQGGGGTVGYPVLTKLLDVSSPTARSFSLIIQSTGMVMAAATILLARRTIDHKALRLGLVGGTVGFFVGAFALGDPDTPFWAAVVPSDYVKVTFTIAVAMVAAIVWLSAGRTYRAGPITGWTRRSEVGLLAFAVTGGILSSLVGSGANVFVFLFAVLVGGLHPRIGIPTSVVVMAWVSVLGLVLFGLVHGQLDVTLVGDQVVAVGGEPVEPVTASSADLYGFWLGAAPIVAWGAPLGSWAASRVGERLLIGFVAAVATAELVSTVVLLESLRTNPALVAYGSIGLVVALAGTAWLSRSGPALFRFAPAEVLAPADPGPATQPAPVSQ